MWGTLNSLVSYVSSEESNDGIASQLLGITYITSRVIAMGFPKAEVEPSLVDAFIEQRPLIQRLAEYYDLKHKGKYMIWNLSEVIYDYTIFHDQIIDIKFPGYPAPPLHQLCSICDAIDHWLKADEQNVAILHCQNGAGRTFTLISCYLAWTKQYNTAMRGLKHISQLKGSKIQDIVNPTQVRYCGYFTNLIKGQLPSCRPVFLKRIILNTIPNFGPNGICRPYLQIFKNAKMIFSSTWASKNIKCYSPEECSIMFPVETYVDGDILVRIRHLASNGDRVSMLRYGFHTGYIASGDSNSRYSKSELDGACFDDRFADDFIVDMVCGPPSTESTELNGEFDAAFWMSMSNRKITDEEALKITPAKPPKSNSNFMINEDDDDEVQDDLNRYVGRATEVFGNLSTTFSTSIQTSAKSFSTIVSSFTTPLTPMPPTLAEKMESQETADSYDDLEKFIQGMGKISEIDELNTLSTTETPTSAAAAPKLNIKKAVVDSTNVSPVILAPILSAETPQTIEKEKVNHIPTSTGRTSMSKEFDDSEFLESVMNQLGVDFDDDDNLDLDNFKLQLDDKDEATVNKKNDKGPSIEELLFDDLP